MKFYKTQKYFKGICLSNIHKDGILGVYFKYSKVGDQRREREWDGDRDKADM